MSQKEKVFSRKQLLVIFKIAFLEAMALSLIIPTISSTGEITQPNLCTSSNGLCSPIRFDSFVYGNSTAIDVTQLSSQSHSFIANQSIVVVAKGETGNVKVSSIKDSALDTFTQRAYNPASGDDFEIWTTITNQTFSGNIITVNWNVTNNAIFGASYYFNVRGIGNTTQSTGLASPASVTLETTQSGSWITGGFGISDSCSAFTVTIGINRGQVCNSSVNDNSIQLLDNATTLSNNVFSTLKSTYTLVGAFDSAAIELIASDNEPKNPNFNHFCTDSNGLCITSQYKLNFAGLASAPTENLALLPGTAYCTGLTTTSLTLTTSDKIWGDASFAGNDRNQTGIMILLQLYVTTTAPSTVFGVGQCSATQTQLGTSTLNWATNVGTGAANSQSTTVSGSGGAGTFAANTYYGYVEMTPYNFVGHLLWLASPGQPYNIQSISILDVK